MNFDPALPWRPVLGTGFNAHIGPIHFAIVDEARFQAYLDLRACHINVGGVCHGGVLMALADTAMGTGSFTAGGERPCTTIAFDARFVAAAREGQRLLAAVRQLRAAGGLSFMEAELWSGGRMVLHASGIWKFLGTGTGDDPRREAPPTAPASSGNPDGG